MSEITPIPYRVDWSIANENLKLILVSLALPEDRLAFAKELRYFEKGLYWVPHDIGEPYTDTISLGLTNYSTFHGDLTLKYSIHEGGRIVFVREAKRRTPRLS